MPMAPCLRSVRAQAQSQSHIHIHIHIHLCQVAASYNSSPQIAPEPVRAGLK